MDQASASSAIQASASSAFQASAPSAIQASASSAIQTSAKDRAPEGCLPDALLISCLVSLGLTANEAALYRTLSSQGDMTGYECAKVTGISRSNAYIALAGLCQKGAAFVVDGPAQRYSPAPAGEFCANKRREFEAAAGYVAEHMPSPAAAPGAYITVKGEAAILDKMKNMIAACDERVYISAGTVILEKVAAELREAIARGRKVVALAERDFQLAGVIRYDMTRKEGQVRLIVDSQFVLTGELAGGRPCSCLFSASDTLVSLFKDAMRNEIRLIELGEMG